MNHADRKSPLVTDESKLYTKVGAELPLTKPSFMLVANTSTSAASRRKHLQRY
jgi:hypothetical protein